MHAQPRRHVPALHLGLPVHGQHAGAGRGAMLLLSWPARPSRRRRSCCGCAAAGPPLASGLQRGRRTAQPAAAQQGGRVGRRQRQAAAGCRLRSPKRAAQQRRWRSMLAIEQAAQQHSRTAAAMLMPAPWLLTRGVMQMYVLALRGGNRSWIGGQDGLGRRAGGVPRLGAPRCVRVSCSSLRRRQLALSAREI
jgi:hypothetical protein